MRHPLQVVRSGWLAGLVLLHTGCASRNVNPPQAQAGHGYVDFYCPSQTNLSWRVQGREPGTGSFKTLFSQVQPLPDGILRLELAPGVEEFQITLLNRLVQAPLSLQVPVQAGRVTPVKVELFPVGETSIARTEQQWGTNIRGSGRKSRYSQQAGTLEQLVGSVKPSVPYRPKSQMDYPP